MFSLKQTYKLAKYNKILLKSWICIVLVSYTKKLED